MSCQIAPAPGYYGLARELANWPYCNGLVGSVRASMRAAQVAAITMSSKREIQ